MDRAGVCSHLRVHHCAASSTARTFANRSIDSRHHPLCRGSLGRSGYEQLCGVGSDARANDPRWGKADPRTKRVLVAGVLDFGIGTVLRLCNEEDWTGRTRSLLCSFFVSRQLFRDSYRVLRHRFRAALGITSMTVRTAILSPIAWPLVPSLGLPNRSRGSALIMLTSIEMAVLSGSSFLYGSLDGHLVAAAFVGKHLPLTRGGYARVIALPSLLLCTFIVLGNQFVLRPERPLNAPVDFVRRQLKDIGSLTRPEPVTTVIVVMSTGLSGTEAYHHIPSYVVGMLGLSVFGLAGIVNDDDIGTGVSRTLLLSLGSVFSLANVVQEYKVPDWLARFLVLGARQLAFNSMPVLVALALAMFASRFLDPSAFIAIPVLFLSVSDVTAAAGIPPLVVMAPLPLASAPSWHSYQDFWIAMGEGITSNQAFAGRERARLAMIYAAQALVTLIISKRYWKLIGALR